MKGNVRPRFDVNALREFAGAKVFARGEAYYRDGSVQILAVEAGRILARVAGTEMYRTVLRGHGKDIDGECSCPAFEDWGFCKHMVAAALAVNARGEGAEGGDTLARIREYLKTKDVDALVEMIVDLAERDPALFDRLDLAAATVSGDDKALEARLLGMIDSATDTPEYVDYYQAGGWATGVEEALDAIAGLTGNGSAALALKLADHAIDRIEEAIGSIDDSDGHCGGLLHQAQEIHLEACLATRPDPVELAQELYDREMADDYDTFRGAAALYADVLGKSGLAEYRRLATEAWQELPARLGRSEFSGDHYRLKDILDFFAERDGDVQARIDIRAKDLSSPRAYLELAQFCLSHGRDEEALKRAEEGLWMFEDEQSDEPLTFFTMELLQKAGREKDAEALLWRAFEKSPSLHLYARLREFGAQARERAIAHLERRVKEKVPTRWHTPADLLISVLMEEKNFDAAWAAAREHGISAHRKESLAKASEATHPDAAVEVYTERVEQIVRAGGGTYEDAAELVARMAPLRGEAEQAAYVANLKERHRRKRNFMKLLE